MYICRRICGFRELFSGTPSSRKISKNSLRKFPLYKLRNREDFINFDGRTVRVTSVGTSEDELALEKNESFDAYF